MLLVAIGLVASFSLMWPISAFRLGDLSLDLSGKALLGLTLIALAWTGTYWTLHRRSQAPLGRSVFPHCILPSAFTAAAWALIALPPEVDTRLLGAAVSSVALAWLIVSEYYVVNLAGPQRARVQWAVELAVYVVAMLVYLAIALRVSESATRAAAVALATSVLGLRLLADTLLSLPSGLDFAQPRPIAARTIGASKWLFIPALGLLLGSLSWLLKVSVPWSLAYSLTLVVSLYVTAGMVRHYLLNRLTWRLALEYLLVGLACLVMLFFFAR